MSSFPSGQINPESVPEIAPARTYEEYEELAHMKINRVMHFAGRMALGVYTKVRMGEPIIVLSDDFVEMQEELSRGGNVIVPTHRDDLDTVLLPYVFEKIGLHHSRPTAKEDLTHLHPIVDKAAWWVAERWGAFPFRRGSKDYSGMNRLKSITLDPEQVERTKRMNKVRRTLASRFDTFKKRPGNITDYNEMTRVTDDILNARREGSGAVHTGGEFDSWYIPVGQAGLSKVKNPRKDENGKRHTLYKDRRSWFGRRERVVITVGAPFKLGKLHNLDEYRAGKLEGAELEEFKAEVEIRNEIMYDKMQAEQERAYRKRGSYLEIDLYEEAA